MRCMYAVCYGLCAVRCAQGREFQETMAHVSQNAGQASLRLRSRLPFLNEQEATRLCVASQEGHLSAITRRYWHMLPSTGPDHRGRRSREYQETSSGGRLGGLLRSRTQCVEGCQIATSKKNEMTHYSHRTLSNLDVTMPRFVVVQRIHSHQILQWLPRRLLKARPMNKCLVTSPSLPDLDNLLNFPFTFFSRRHRICVVTGRREWNIVDTRGSSLRWRSGAKL